MVRSKMQGFRDDVVRGGQCGGVGRVGKKYETGGRSYQMLP